MKVGLADQVILDVAEQQAVLALWIDEVAHALGVVELTLRKAALLVSDLAVSDLLNERVVVGVEDQESVVG